MIILRLSEVKVVHQKNVSLFFEKKNKKQNYIKLKVHASQTDKRNLMALSFYKS